MLTVVYERLVVRYACVFFCKSESTKTLSDSKQFRPISTGLPINAVDKEAQNLYGVDICLNQDSDQRKYLR